MIDESIFLTFSHLQLVLLTKPSEVAKTIPCFPPISNALTKNCLGEYLRENLKAVFHSSPHPIWQQEFEKESYNVKLSSAVIVILSFDEGGSRPVAWNWQDCHEINEASQKREKILPDAIRHKAQSQTELYRLTGVRVLHKHGLKAGSETDKYWQELPQTKAH